MTIPDKFNVKETPRPLVRLWILKKHYTHRVPSISYCYGLYVDGELVGVCSFGTPPSPSLRKGICGEKYADKVLELNRLVSEDDLPKNALSYFVSKCLQKLPHPRIIVSFADPSHGHHGYIYQATNFIYTGLSADRTDWVIEGEEEKHGISIADKMRGVENRAEKLREKYGDKFKLKERPRKHRYVYFIGNKRQKREMRKNLNYREKPYPKGKNEKYDIGKFKEKQVNLTKFAGEVSEERHTTSSSEG